MEPRDKARSLALLRQLAAWRFEGHGGLHEQLIKYEEALRAYESASGKEFSKDLVLATVLTGLKEPLRSQVQFRMTPATTYAELREWILQYESLNTPWGMVGPGQKAGSTKYDDSGHQPMDVDRVWAGKGGKYGKYGKGGKDGKGKGKDSKGKGKDGKGKTKDGKGKGGKTKDGKGQGQDRWSTWAASSWNDPEACRICGKRGHWKWECPQGKGKNGYKGAAKGKVQQIEQQPQQPSSTASSAAPSVVSTALPPSASVYRGSASVNVVEAFVSTPPGCRVTEVFDITELDEEGEFSLEGSGVLRIEAAGSEHEGGQTDEEAIPERDLAESDDGHMSEAAILEDTGDFLGVPTFPMDGTDGDDNWTVAPGLEPEPQPVAMVNAVTSGAVPGH